MIGELQWQLAEMTKAWELEQMKVITCGIAARDPDPLLTTKGPYAHEWDSPQAQAVRTLRRSRDFLEQELRKRQATPGVQ